MYYKPLETTTKVFDVKKLVDNFFSDNNLLWNMVSAVCLDEAPVMLGIKFGFGALVKAEAPHVIVLHYIVHSHVLATETLSPKLAKGLKTVVECVNNMRNSALRHHIFSEQCKEMGSEIEVLMYHFNVWRLPPGTSV